MMGIEQLFHHDVLSSVMMVLIGFVALCIAVFAWRYLAGDRGKGAFYGYLLIVVVCLFVLVMADHMAVLLGAIAGANFGLVRLLGHNRQWPAAQQSARLAWRNFTLGWLLLCAALLILYGASGESSIQAMLDSDIASGSLWLSSSLIVLAAMTQSALWPFHKWLSNSLNAPTPVSAIMHAGLVNGGGFLLARFAPLLSEQPLLLTAIFVIGIVSAILATLWKLIQSNIKQMLAYSTMGQMGFMIAQCGLGLLPAAIAHIFWHGLFKAYLFLSSGSAAKEPRLSLHYPPSALQFLLALTAGVSAAVIFAATTHKSVFAGDTTLFLLVITVIAGTQVALPLMKANKRLTMPLAFTLTASLAFVYGLSVSFIEHTLAPLAMSHPQPLNIIHISALVVMTTTWMWIIFAHKSAPEQVPKWQLKAYVALLNSSQPQASTMTAHRNHYQV